MDVREEIGFDADGSAIAQPDATSITVSFLLTIVDTY